METQIGNLIEAYIDFNNNYCTINQSALNLAWLADKLEYLARRVRKISDSQLDKVGAVVKDGN